MMKLYAIFILTIALFGISEPTLWAQIPISQSQVQAIFDPGSSFRLFSAPESLSALNVGPTGGPHVYDFSHIPFTSHLSTNIYSVSQVPSLVGHYPDDGITFGNSPTSIENNPILLFTNDTLMTIGEAFVSPDSQKYRHHTPPNLFAVFPAQYGDTLLYTESPGSGVETTYVSGSPVRTSDGWNSSGTSIFDGYGTLKIGSFELECLRIRSVEVFPYTHKGFTFLTREGLILIVESTRDQPDSGTIAITGVFYILGGPLVDVPGQTTLPARTELFQNFPNPFNPTTTIRFTLQRSSHVTLSIYNILGMEPVKLADGRYSAGQHEVVWNAGEQSAGTYVYRLSTDERISTGKLILLK